VDATSRALIRLWQDSRAPEDLAKAAASIRRHNNTAYATALVLVAAGATRREAAQVCMDRVSGIVYGHYDSRGGTTLVVAPTRQAADDKYLTLFGSKDFDYKKELGEEAAQQLCGDDYIYPATLYFFDNELIRGDADDLESEIDLGGGNFQCKGYVLEPGERTYWPPREADITGFFVDGSRSHQDLEYVFHGREPFLLREGWNHPRWNDDAYSFQVLW
jgi:hypothetical protein